MTEEMRTLDSSHCLDFIMEQTIKNTELQKETMIKVDKIIDKVVNVNRENNRYRIKHTLICFGFCLSLVCSILCFILICAVIPEDNLPKQTKIVKEMK